MLILWEEASFPAPITLPFGTIAIEETPMVRLRLATLAVAAGLGLVGGCMTVSQCPLLGRFRAHPAGDCGAPGGGANGEAPILERPVLNGAIPGGPTTVPAPFMTPQNTIPPLASPPRLTPQPQAQPTPYTP